MEPTTHNARYWVSDTLVKVENVSLSIGNKLILRDINLEVKDIHRNGCKQGQVIGFFGKSGTGKTKLSELLSGLRKPTTGAVTVGKTQHEVQRGEVGMVQQHYPLFNNRTVYGNLLVACELSTTPKNEREDRVMHIMSRFGMADYRTAYPTQLSGGQRQRIAIAQQLLCSEHYIILDEPFSGLDISMIDEVSHLIQEISLMDEENTVIIVSHDLATTAALSDRLWMMGKETAADGTQVPGSKILREYDLAAMGLAWEPQIEEMPAFTEMLADIKQYMRTI